MKKFNESLDNLKTRGTELSPAVDTDSNVGSFGKPEGEVAEAPKGDKLVLYIDGGIEIHIPTEVFQQMASAMSGEQEQEVGPEISQDLPVEAPKPCGNIPNSDGGDSDEKEKSPCEDDNKKDCPFEKKDKPDEDKKEEE